VSSVKASGFTKTQTPKSNRIHKFSAFDFILLAIMSIYGLLILYPFYNAILVSIVPNTVYIRYPGLMLIPPEISLDSYAYTFKSALIWGGFGNSVFVTLAGTVYNMLLTVLLGYALTKPMYGNKIFKFLIVFTMYFSGGLIPFYLQVKNLGLINSLWSMILPTGINIMYMLIISNYFVSLPPSLEESAKIDGAGDFTILLRIILPLSLPLLATFTLYYAVDRWNEWYYAMLFVRSTKNWPLQYVLRTIIQDANFLAQHYVPGQEAPDIKGDAIKMSAAIVSMAPIMCLYPFLQRYFLTGLTLGAVKE
jgi:putative aldouronate transport system permease protein